MFDSYTQLNPDKVIVFITKESQWKIAGSRKRTREIQELKDQYQKNIQFVQFDPLADHVNGSVPQDPEHMKKFIEKSKLGPANHIVLLAEESGIITEAAKTQGVTPMLVSDFSAEKVASHIWKSGALGHN
jgi:hypothetical protein